MDTMQREYVCVLGKTVCTCIYNVCVVQFSRLHMCIHACTCMNALFTLVSGSLFLHFRQQK